MVQIIFRIDIPLSDVLRTSTSFLSLAINITTIFLLISHLGTHTVLIRARSILQSRGKRRIYEKVTFSGEYLKQPKTSLESNFILYSGFCPWFLS